MGVQPPELDELEELELDELLDDELELELEELELLDDELELELEELELPHSLLPAANDGLHSHLSYPGQSSLLHTSSLQHPSKFWSTYSLQ